MARAAKQLALFGRAGIEVLQLPVRCAAFPGQIPECLYSTAQGLVDLTNALGPLKNRNVKSYA